MRPVYMEGSCWEGVVVSASRRDLPRGHSRLDVLCATFGHLPMQLSTRELQQPFFSCCRRTFFGCRKWRAYCCSRAFWLDARGVSMRSINYVSGLCKRQATSAAHNSAPKNFPAYDVSFSRELATDDTSPALVFEPHRHFYQVNDIQKNSTRTYIRTW